MKILYKHPLLNGWWVGMGFVSFRTERTKSNVNIRLVVDRFPFSDIDYPDLALINRESYCLNFDFSFFKQYTIN